MILKIENITLSKDGLELVYQLAEMYKGYMPSAKIYGIGPVAIHVPDEYEDRMLNECGMHAMTFLHEDGLRHTVWARVSPDTNYGVELDKWVRKYVTHPYTLVKNMVSGDYIEDQEAEAYMAGKLDEN